MLVRACVWVLGRVGMFMRIRAYSLANPARNAILWRHLWPLGLRYICRHYLTNGEIFGKKVTGRKRCVYIFSTTFFQNISHFKKNLARYRQKCRDIFMQSTIYLCRILIKFEFSPHIFECYVILWKFFHRLSIYYLGRQRVVANIIGLILQFLLAKVKWEGKRKQTTGHEKWMQWKSVMQHNCQLSIMLRLENAVNMLLQ
jgi:hypothetical protein